MLQVLIIGAGNIAGGFDANRPSSDLPFSHAGAYCRHGGFRVLGCVEPNEETRKNFMARWNVEVGFASTAEALNASLRYDVISICSPTMAHEADMASALLLEPRLLFCEKPVTPSLESSISILERFDRAGIPVVVNYTRRWDSVIQGVASQLKAGAWGAVRSASAVYTKGILNNGSHMIDLLHLLLGPLHVLAAGAPIVDMWKDDPSIPAFLMTENAVPVFLNCGYAQDYALFELEIVTEHGVLTMEDGGLAWRIRRTVDSPTFNGYKNLNHGSYSPGDLQAATLAAVREIHQVLTQGGTLSSSGENALAAQRVCESIRTMANRSQN
ncbi:Gfo/Idh/MocA family protein [Herbaspirillum sp. NPDC101397]|uniref:Gfo/Idh/MocA family protein n=1 Tax=Herbaspirillum sp. NPDC101397 TaxID=3364006 RepID=UPI00383AAE13